MTKIQSFFENEVIINEEKYKFKKNPLFNN